MRRLTLGTLVAVLLAVVAPAADFGLPGLGKGGAEADSPFAVSDFIPLPGSLDGAASRPLVAVRAIPSVRAVAPGQPFHVAIEFRHQSEAYSYWVNPGGPGLSARFSWTLPDGFSVSEPVWPAPSRYVTGDITSYIHKGTVHVLTTVTPPAQVRLGETLTFNAMVDTQICTSTTCTPIQLPVEFSLPVAEDSGGENPAFAKAMDNLPDTPRSWRFEANDYGDELVLAMYPSVGFNPDLDDVYFFDRSGDPLVDSQGAQKLEKEGGVWWLRTPKRDKHSVVGSTVSGVVYAGTGWLEGNPDVSAFFIDLPVTSADSKRPPGLQKAVVQQTMLLLVMAFLGGLLLNVMPCVFPVIGLKIMGFAKQAHKDRRSIFWHGFAYMAGVLLCFWTLSFLVITMGRGWGAQLQSVWFLFALCHLFMIMSMNMAGVFDIGASMAGAGQSLSGREGVKRSFLTGLLATITSTPCSAPFLGTALAYALSLPPVLSLGVFTLMGLGFSFPYLALSLFPGWLKKLPKPGPWMDTFRQAMAFPLFATTAYMFWTMEAMLEEWHFLMLLFGLVATAMACWLYGKSQKSRVRSIKGSRVLFATAAVVLGFGLWLGNPGSRGKLEWQEWSPEVVTRLRAEGRPVYIDFTARWCATCQVNKRVYQDPALAQLLLDKNVALLKADWTKYDDRITSTLKEEFNKAAVPVTVLYSPGAASAAVLPEILTVNTVLEHIQALP